MKKTLLTTGSILIGLLSISNVAFAAENKSTAVTEGTISVKKPTDDSDGKPIDPVNPIDPDDPFTPDDPNPGTDGLLTIDQAPDFNFGTLELGTAQTKYAMLQSGKDSKQETITVPNYVQVTDKSGNYSGWELSLTRSEFKTADEQNSLQGSLVTFTNAVVKTGTGIGAGTPSIVNGTTESPLLIPVDQKTVLVKANTNEGIGTWVYSLGESDEDAAKAVSLYVPVSNYAEGSYASNFNWTLTDAPSA